MSENNYIFQSGSNKSFMGKRISRITTLVQQKTKKAISDTLSIEQTYGLYKEFKTFLAFSCLFLKYLSYLIITAPTAVSMNNLMTNKHAIEQNIGES